MNVSPDYPYPVPFPTTGVPPPGSQVLTGPAVRSAYNDSSPIAWDDWIGGGYRSVGSAADRDSIEDSWRKEGMLALTCDTNIIYRLDADLVTWNVHTILPPTGSVTKAMSEDVSTATIRGRVAAGTGVPEDLTAAQVKTLLALVKADVGLGSVDNTADASKPVSTAQAAADAAVLASALQRANHTGTQGPSTITGGTSTTVAFFNASGVLSGDSTLVFDTTAKQIGIDKGWFGRSGSDFLGYAKVNQTKRGFAVSSSGTGIATIASSASFTAISSIYSVELWVKASPYSTSTSFLVARANSGSPEVQSTFQIFRNGVTNNLLIRLGDGTTAYSYTGAAAVFNNLWHHLVMTYDGARVKLYVDGALDIDQALAITVYNTALPTHIGHRYGGYIFTGSIDEVRFYSTALTAGNVATRYAAGVGLYGTTPDTGLVAGYHCDEGSGSTCSDYSGNANTMALTSMTFERGKVSDTSYSPATSDVVFVRAANGSSINDLGVMTLGVSGVQTIANGSTLDFRTGGVTRIYVDEAGNCGFGASVPTVPLTVQGSGTVLALQNDSGLVGLSFTSTGAIVAGASGCSLVSSTGFTMMSFSTGTISFLTNPISTVGVQFTGTGTGTQGIYTSSYATPLWVNNDAVRLGATGNTIKVIAKATAGQTLNTFEAQDSANVLMGGFGPTGELVFSRTVTAPGTTGAVTINKPSGTVNIAAGGTTVIVTNSIVASTSFVHVALRTDDATATIKNCVPASGSFAINLTAAATAEVSISFVVFK